MRGGSTCCEQVKVGAAGGGVSRRAVGAAGTGELWGAGALLEERVGHCGMDEQQQQQEQRWYGAHMVADMRPCTQLRLRRRAQQPVPTLSPKVLSSSDAAKSLPVLIASELLVMPG